MWPVVAILDHAVFLNDISETFLYYLAKLDKYPKYMYECCAYYNRMPNCGRQNILHTLHQLKINCPWVLYLAFIPVIDGLQEFSNGQSSLHWRHNATQWARWRLKSTVSRLFTQAFTEAQIKENIKAPRHWPLCREFTGDRWIPRTNGQ